MGFRFKWVSGCSRFCLVVSGFGVVEAFQVVQAPQAVEGPAWNWGR